ncbi:hypothetical protein LCM19_03415 [Qipengyuania flava]|nr:hypothetical protein [Qipengyuania flava]
MDWLAFGLLRNRFVRNDDEWSLADPLSASPFLSLRGAKRRGNPQEGKRCAMDCFASLAMTSEVTGGSFGTAYGGQIARNDDGIF